MSTKAITGLQLPVVKRQTTPLGGAEKPTVAPNAELGTDQVGGSPTAKRSAGEETATLSVGEEARLKKTIGGEEATGTPSTTGDARAHALLMRAAALIDTSAGPNARHDVLSVLERLDATTDEELKKKGEKLLDMLAPLLDRVQQADGGRPLSRGHEAIGKSFLAGSIAMAAHGGVQEMVPALLQGTATVAYGALGVLVNVNDVAQLARALRAARDNPAGADTVGLLLQSAKVIAGLASWIVAPAVFLRIGLEAASYLRDRAGDRALQRGEVPADVRRLAEAAAALVQELGDALDARATVKA